MRAADDFPLRLGDTATSDREFSADDVAAYRRLAEDGGLRFGDGDGVPGPLLAGMISDLLGTTLPGLGTNWMKQSLDYRGSAPVGAGVTAAVTIERMVPEKGLVYLHSECRCAGEVVVDGRTLVLVRNLAERAVLPDWGHFYLTVCRRAGALLSGVEEATRELVEAAAGTDVFWSEEMEETFAAGLRDGGIEAAVDGALDVWLRNVRSGLSTEFGLAPERGMGIDEEAAAGIVEAVARR